MSLYLKYRPETLEDIFGNDELVKSLSGLLAKGDKCPHTFLLHGPTGCGKTTIARIIATQLGCVGSDYQEVNFANFRGIDTVREIVQNSIFKPLEGKTRVWVIDECHKMTNDAQNAFLKILEDTPEHVYFVLCTTDPQKLLSTLKGRCSQLQVNRLEQPLLYGLLRRVVRSEAATLEKEVFDQIIKSSNGQPRNALQILEQVLVQPKELQLETAKKAEAELKQASELCRALIKGAGWKEISAILSGLKDQDPEGIRRAVLGYCQAVLLSGKDEPMCGLIMEEFLPTTYDNGFNQITFASYSVIKNRHI